MAGEARKNEDFQKLGDLFGRQSQAKKPPAFPWQELALKIIKELNVPAFKKSSIFKVCKDRSKEFIEICFNDTKELCRSGEKWKYFLKLTNKSFKK